MNSGSSEAIHSTGQAERCLLLSSSSQKSRPCRMGTSLSVRWTTNTFSTRDRPSTAWSTVCFKGIFRPPRSPSLAVKTTLQPASRMRSEEHTSELQSRQYLVCRLLLDKKKVPDWYPNRIG